jgi:pilus assembly protein CpaB
LRAQTDTPENRAVAQIRARAILFLVIAIVAGGGAVVLVQQYLKRMKSVSSAAAHDTSQVVVAAMDVPIAVQLEAKHLMTIAWPAGSVPEGSYSDVKLVLDKTVRQGLVKGEAVLTSRLADETSGQGLAALLADGMRAMAVEVDAVVGVAGFVQPGDFVDVITTMQPDDETRKDRQDEAAKVSKIILQNVRVLAVGEHLTTSSGGKPVNVKVVTLGVTPPESEKLALASQYGSIQLSLRSRIDQLTELTPGVTPATLLAAEGVATAPVAQVEEEQKPRQTYRSTRAERAAAAALAVAPAPVQAAPVVEILRGTRVEERTLRSPTVTP